VDNLKQVTHILRDYNNNNVLKCIFKPPKNGQRLAGIDILTTEFWLLAPGFWLLTSENSKKTIPALKK
jgi:hypothetical protein